MNAGTLMRARFESACEKCNYTILKDERIRFNGSASHAYEAQCEAAKARYHGGPGKGPMVTIPASTILAAATPDTRPVVVKLPEIADLFKDVADRLKRPKWSFEGVTVEPGKQRTVNIKLRRDKRLAVTIGEGYGDSFRGFIEADGTYAPRRDAPKLVAFLVSLNEDPVGVAAEYGRGAGACCFCRRSLTNDKTGASVELGYGPVCAKHWKLPWGAKAVHKAKTLRAAQEAHGAAVVADDQAETDLILDEVA